MIKLTFYFLTFISIWCLSSCNVVSNNEEETKYTTSVREVISQKSQALPLSNYCSSIKYILLESRKEAMIRKLLRIEFSDKHLFVSDGKKILKYHLDGTFVRQIGSVGKGPEEYGAGRVNFVLDPVHEEVFVWNTQGQVVVYRQTDGMYLRRFSVRQRILDMAYSKSADRLVVVGQRTEDKEGDLFLYKDMKRYDRMGMATDSLNYHNSSKKHIGMGSICYSLKDHIHFMFGSDDLMYEMNSDGSIHPYIHFDFENSVSYEQVDVRKNSYPNYLQVLSPVEMDDALFYVIKKGFNRKEVKFYFSVFDKKSGQSTLAKHIIDDIHGVGTFWPVQITDSGIIGQASASTILSECEKKNIDKATLGLQDLTMESNPVVIIAK
ncbi:6-bladed beta-propeller [Halosquirtibacter xylanolyticus]|uniref:6-bladed beta-propeller n=1 Tax=Halosquirtibacter xylanolyticus TaxID=3374599 RepID=UPI00374820FE|nr:6-bladed beta-propeller [Prolixibacteraceae bacterium]